MGVARAVDNWRIHDAERCTHYLHCTHHQSPRGVLTLVILMSAACSPASPDTDLAQCRVELAKLPTTRPARTDEEQLAFVHNCMEAKDWRAPEGCVKSDFQGTWMCDYKKR